MKPTSAVTHSRRACNATAQKLFFYCAQMLKILQMCFVTFNFMLLKFVFSFFSHNIK